MSEIKALYIVNNPMIEFIESFNQLPDEERALYIKKAYEQSYGLVEEFMHEMLKHK